MATYSVDMRLVGQEYEVSVETPHNSTVGELNTSFEAEYMSRFGRVPWSGKREIVNWIVKLVQTQPLSERHSRSGEPLSENRVNGVRKAYFGPEYGWIETPVFDRASLVQGEQFDGPLLVADEGSTIVVGPTHRSYRDEFGNVHVENLEPTPI